MTNEIHVNFPYNGHSLSMHAESSEGIYLQVYNEGSNRMNVVISLHNRETSEAVADLFYGKGSTTMCFLNDTESTGRKDDLVTVQRNGNVCVDPGDGTSKMLIFVGIDDNDNPLNTVVVRLTDHESHILRNWIIDTFKYVLSAAVSMELVDHLNEDD